LKGGHPLPTSTPGYATGLGTICLDCCIYPLKCSWIEILTCNGVAGYTESSRPFRLSYHTQFSLTHSKRLKQRLEHADGNSSLS